MNESIFLPTSFFLLRAPLWPIEKLELIFSEEKKWKEIILDIFDQDELLREAICIASPTLYEALKRRPIKDLEQACKSLLNYMVRMATRATPFGLFSFIATGSWAAEASAYLELAKIDRRARPDMEWIYTFVKKTYQESPHFPSLLVQSNNLIELKADRIILKYSRFTEQEKNKVTKTVSLRANSLVLAILEKANTCLSIDQLWLNLLDVLPNLDKVKTFKVIKELLAQQILLPGVLPSLLCTNPLQELIRSLPNEASINEIERQLAHYHSTSLGKGEDALLLVQKDMHKLISGQSSIQVDANYKGKPIQLPIEVLSKLQRGATLLWKLSANRPPYFTALESYRKRFIEKYGVNRVVPLMELLNAEKGLGSFLATLPIAEKTVPSKFSQVWEKWLYKEWQESILHRKEEIVINEERINSLFKLAEEEQPNPHKALPSFDLFFKIQAQSIQDINRGNYLLYISDFSWSGGSTFGRFWDLYDTSTQCELTTLVKAEDSLECNVKYVEISYWPSRVRNANVAIHPCLRDYSIQIDCKEKSSLSLQDLYIGTTHDRFYITLKDGKEEILARSGNVLNYAQAPEPLRLLREITLSRYQLIYPFFWGDLEEKALFLPRVRVEECILSAARWNLDGSSFQHDALEVIKSKFLSWAQEWKLPDRFLLMRGDQHLLLNLNHPAHLQEILTKLKKGEFLQLTEEITSNWLKSNTGCHLGEFVVPFIKNSIYHYPFIEKTLQTYSQISLTNRWKLPGSEWFYIKIYLSEELENSFLLKKFLPFTEHLNELSSIKGWFYVRYQDPDRHLRIRIRLEGHQDYGLILSWLHKESLQWMEKGIISKIMLDSYEREVERYGGNELIEIAESLFCADSLAIANLLKNFQKKEDIFSETVWQVLSVISFLNGFGLDEQTKIEVLGNFKQDQNLLKGFREYKNILLKLIPALENSSSLEDEVVSIIKISAEIRSYDQHLFCRHAQHLDHIKVLEIYSHMVHMHCNRLGCTYTQESRLRLFCQHALQTYINSRLAVNSLVNT